MFIQPTVSVWWFPQLQPVLTGFQFLWPVAVKSWLFT